MKIAKDSLERGKSSGHSLEKQELIPWESDLMFLGAFCCCCFPHPTKMLELKKTFSNTYPVVTPLRSPYSRCLESWELETMVKISERPMKFLFLCNVVDWLNRKQKSFAFLPVRWAPWDYMSTLLIKMRKWIIWFGGLIIEKYWVQEETKWGLVIFSRGSSHQPYTQSLILCLSVERHTFWYIDTYTHRHIHIHVYVYIYICI